MLAPVPKIDRRFQLVLIKPSHYDDDGYVIQWWRSSIPSNSLACVYTARRRRARVARCSGRTSTIDITADRRDQHAASASSEIIDADSASTAGFGMVGLVGVQSNQFPRALDIARPLRAAGIQVVIGGFHVSGCLSMLPEMQADLQDALDMGITLFAGEAEGRIDEVLRDALPATLKPHLQLS